MRDWEVKFWLSESWWAEVACCINRSFHYTFADYFLAKDAKKIIINSNCNPVKE
jgi:hypothetical protein